MPRTSGGILKTLETAAISVCDLVPSRNEQDILGLFRLRSACSRYVPGVAWWSSRMVTVQRAGPVLQQAGLGACDFHVGGRHHPHSGHGRHLVDYAAAHPSYPDHAHSDRLRSAPQLGQVHQSATTTGATIGFSRASRVQLLIGGILQWRKEARGPSPAGRAESSCKRRGWPWPPSPSPRSSSPAAPSLMRPRRPSFPRHARAPPSGCCSGQALSSKPTPSSNDKQPNGVTPTA